MKFTAPTPKSPGFFSQAQPIYNSPSPPNGNFEHNPAKGFQNISGPTLTSKPNPIVPKGYRPANFDTPRNITQKVVPMPPSSMNIPRKTPVMSSPAMSPPQSIQSSSSSSSSSTKKCINCNSQWATNVTFCGNCGNRV